jgi:hypothetical protein
MDIKFIFRFLIILLSFLNPLIWIRLESFINNSPNISYLSIIASLVTFILLLVISWFFYGCKYTIIVFLLFIVSVIMIFLIIIISINFFNTFSVIEFITGKKVIIYHGNSFY